MIKKVGLWEIVEFLEQHSGENWFSQSCGTTKLLRSVYFADNQIGWIVVK